MPCFRCGREGHYANTCYAKTNVRGKALSSSKDSEADSGSSDGVSDYDHEDDSGEEESGPRYQPYKKRRQVSGSAARPSKARPAGRAGVYVLRTASGMYYVGKSADIDSRIKQHRSGVGAMCLNGEEFQVMPRLLTSGSVSDLESWERNETLQRMRANGIDNVRGWMYTSSGPLSDDERQDVFRQICEKFDLCRRCGREGHFAHSCFAKSFDKWTGNHMCL